MRSARKRVFFGASAVALSAIVATCVLLAVDLYFHHRFDSYASLNWRGYRGPIVGRKRPGERRVVMLGGSTVYGESLFPGETIPASLERQLRTPGAPPTTVVNLGASGNGALTFRTTLADYRSLEPDVAIFYEGYNDLGPVPNTGNTRHDSPIFRLIGYYPILPTVLREKALMLRYGDISAAYRGERTVFRPRRAGQITAVALEAAAAISTSLERQLGRLSPDRTRDGPVTPAPCPPRWEQYCTAVSEAIHVALDHHENVLVVTQPYLSDEHVEQQRALEAMLLKAFPAEPRVRYLNLGRAIDLHDRSIAFDGMHLTGAGNDRIASQLVEPVRELLGSRR